MDITHISILRKILPSIFSVIDNIKLVWVYVIKRSQFRFTMGQPVTCKGLAIGICTQIDSPKRLKNLFKVIDVYKDVAPIYVYETGTKKHNLPKDVNHVYKPTHKSHYHKTKYLNALVRKIKEPYVLLLDTDIIISYADLEKAYQVIKNDDGDIVYPYNGLVIDIKNTSSIGNTSLAKQISQKSSTLGLGNACGGALMITKKAYLSMKGFHEKIYGWGYEDDEFVARARGLNMRITRTRNCAFHLRHPRTKTSLPSQYTRHAYRLYKRSQSMSSQELREEIASWT